MITLRPRERRKPDFSLATINIVFLLLLFFLVAGSVVQRNETGIDAPLAQELPLERLPRPLLVVTQSGLQLDGVAVDRSSLTEAAREKTERPGTYLNILADRELPAQNLMDVLAIAGRAGIPARIVTIREEGDTATP